MIFYHGTTLSRAMQILRDKRIKVTSKEITRYNDDDYSSTELGFVYLSDILNIAWGYAIETSAGLYPDGPRVFVVFKIEICEDEVEIDTDNERHRAIASELYQEGNHCYRIARDLILHTEVIEVLALKMKSYNQGCFYADLPNFETKVLNKWKKL